MPTISVIIPVYKVERYLDACVTERGGSDLPGYWRCMLVDDGSPDRCPGPVRCLGGESDRRVRVIHRSRTVGFPLRATPASRPPALAVTSSLWTATTFWSRIPFAALWPSRSAPARSWSSSTYVYANDRGERLADAGLQRIFQDEILDEDGVVGAVSSPAGNTKKSTIPSLGTSCTPPSFLRMACAFPRASGTRIMFMLPHILHRAVPGDIALPGLPAATAMPSAPAASCPRATGSATIWTAANTCWSGTTCFAAKGDYLRAEGLLNDAIENLAEKDRFDLSTTHPTARATAQACRACADGLPRPCPSRTGRRSMLLRAALLRLGLPVYRGFPQTQSVRSFTQWSKHNRKKQYHVHYGPARGPQPAWILMNCGGIRI